MDKIGRHKGIIRTHQSSVSLVYRLFDFIIIFLCLHVSILLRGEAWKEPFLIMGLVTVIVFFMSAEALGLYRSWRSESIFSLFGIAFSSWCLSCVVLLVLAYFTKTSVDYSRLVVGVWFSSTLTTLILWRYLVRKVLKFLRRRGMNSKTVAIIGVSPKSTELGKNILKHPGLGMKLAGYFDDRGKERINEQLPADIVGTADDAIALAKEGLLDIIYIVLPMKAEERIADILNRCSDTTATVHIVPDFFVYNLLHARWGHIGGISTLSVYDTPFYGVSSALKRAQDIVCSIAILTMIFIPMLVIGLAIRLTSKGKVIFKQDRYGLDGRKILVWKFRTMTASENCQNVVQVKKYDTRVTPVGRLLRKTSLDELPQFINVLQGRMSIVGPRPHAVEHNEIYRSLVDGYMLRHKVKPGITGWAQVNGWRGETDSLCKMEKRIEFDLAYIRSWSLWLDFKIMVLTIFKGFLGENAY